MSTFPLYNQEGTAIGSVEQPALFETPVDSALIQRYLVWVRSVLRDSISHTKTRGEVRGGGKKPWRQKGTGRARVGSSRSPLWRSGGTVFGPLSSRNWHLSMPRTERRKALFSAFASKAAANQVIVLDSWEIEKPRTEAITSLLAKFPVTEKQRVLLVQPTFSEAHYKSAANVPQVAYRTISRIGLADLLDNDLLFITKEGLTELASHFSPEL